jgi:tight adherence protein B
VTGRAWLAALLVLLAAAGAGGRRFGVAGRWRGVLRPQHRPGLSGRLRALARPEAFLAVSAGQTRRVAAAAAAVAGVAMGAAAGAVAGLVTGVYAGVAAVAVLRSLRGRAEARNLIGAVEAVGMLAADLRAGLPAPAAVEAVRDTVDRAPMVAARVAAALDVADRTGAPVADVLDRLDADLRAAARLRAAMVAQAAGSRASAWLLAVLPVAGVALGPVVGADSLRVVLHTPLGAGCVSAAIALQLGGLAWSFRLARVAA